MPGLVAFRRRWAVGSDDLVISAGFTLIIHIVWLIVLSIVLGVVDFDDTYDCAQDLHDHVLGYLVILCLCIILEALICWISLRGTILYTRPRDKMQYVLYCRLAVLLVELIWLILGVVWVADHYHFCPAGLANKTVLGVVVLNWLVMICLLAVLWCTFDRAGRSWVKLKVSKKQEAIRRSKSRVERRMSRAKQTQELYEANWDRRFRFLCCCAGVGDAQQNSFAEVAKLFSEFFHELDVVPSDIIAGFMLLREEQKRRRKLIVANQGNNIYEFLSGVPITPQTQHLNLTDPVTKAEFKSVLYYFKFAIAAYGWPLYMIMNKTTGLCKLARHCRCCCCNLKNSAEVVDQDNCCQCNFTALKRQLGLPESDIVYATFHSAVSETPFFVVIDHEHHKVVISVRGTLSLQDCLTDLSADISQLPVDGMPDDWLGHKGMVEAAMYIKRKLKDEFILARAFGHDKERGTHTYDLVLVGHSLGAGTAAILAILLKPEFPSLYCYAYSPPGGLLSMSVVEHTKDFITSVVVGKDIVIRIGLAQMEYMRSDLISCIKRSQDPKWLIISGGLFCCCNIRDVNMQPSTGQEDFSPSPTRVDVAAHPSDLSILLSTHVPLYPPGKIMHIVRNHPNNVGCLTNPTVYHALWVENTSFDEVLVSPVMLNDHLPYNVQDALEKCLLHAEQGKVALEIHTEVSESCSEIYMNQHNSNNVGQNDNDCDDTLRNGYQDPDRRTVSTMSWDYPHPDDKEVNEHLRRPDQYVDRHSGKHSSEVSNDMESSYNGDWLSKAPLARPESLSESSSMYSVVSESRKSSSFTTRSGRPHRTEGYCYYVDPVDSPEEAYGKAFAAGPYSRNQITTLATIEGTPTHFATSASPVHTQRGLSSGTDHANDSAQTVQSSDSGVVTTGEEIPLTVLNRPLPEGSPPPKPPRLSQAKMIQENPSKDLPPVSPLPVSPAPTLGRGYTEYLPLPSDPDFDDNMLSPIPKDDDEVDAKETDRLTDNVDNRRTFVTSTPSTKRTLSLEEYQNLKETEC